MINGEEQETCLSPRIASVICSSSITLHDNNMGLEKEA